MSARELRCRDSRFGRLSQRTVLVAKARGTVSKKPLLISVQDGHAHLLELIANLVRCGKIARLAQLRALLQQLIHTRHVHLAGVALSPLVDGSGNTHRDAETKLRRQAGHLRPTAHLQATDEGQQREHCSPRACAARRSSYDELPKAADSYI